MQAPLVGAVLVAVGAESVEAVRLPAAGGQPVEVRLHAAAVDVLEQRFAVERHVLQKAPHADGGFVLGDPADARVEGRAGAERPIVVLLHVHLRQPAKSPRMRRAYRRLPTSPCKRSRSPATGSGSKTTCDSRAVRPSPACAGHHATADGEAGSAERRQVAAALDVQVIVLRERRRPAPQAMPFQCRPGLRVAGVHLEQCAVLRLRGPGVAAVAERLGEVEAGVLIARFQVDQPAVRRARGPGAMGAEALGGLLRRGDRGSAFPQGVVLAPDSSAGTTAPGASRSPYTPPGAGPEQAPRAASGPPSGRRPATRTSGRGASVLRGGGVRNIVAAA